jgi:hypothetical protein
MIQLVKKSSTSQYSLFEYDRFYMNGIGRVRNMIRSLFWGTLGVLALLLISVNFANAFVVEATRNTHIKLILGTQLIRDEQLRKIAIEASDDVGDTIGALVHFYLTPEEIIEEIGWTQTANLLLCPPSRNSSFIGKLTPNGRPILRSCYVPRIAKNWGLDKDGNLSFSLIFADPSAPKDIIVELQTYQKISGRWRLIKQERAE